MVPTIRARKVIELDPDDIWDLIVGSEIDVEFDDGTLRMTCTEVVLSAYTWMLHKYLNKLPLLKSHTIQSYKKDGHDTRAMHIKLMGTLFKLAVARFRIRDRKHIYEILDIIVRINNKLYNKAFYTTARYTTASSVMDSILLHEHPTLVDEKEKLFGVELDEEIVSNSVNKVNDMLCNDMLNPDGQINPWSWMATRGLVKAKQLSQSVYLRGYITDIDGSIIDYPILDCYLSGMRTYRSYNIVARENADAVKSTEDELQRASTDSRRMTYASSYKRAVVEGDCGSKEYIDFSVETDKHLGIIAGSYIWDEKFNQLRIVEESHTHLIGTMVKLRSQTTCDIDDPSVCCEVCAGLQYLSVPPLANMGGTYSKGVHHGIVQRKISKKHHLDSSSGLANNSNRVFNDYFRETKGRQLYLKTAKYNNKEGIFIRISSDNGNLLAVNDTKNVRKLALSQVSTIHDLTLVMQLKTRTDEIKIDMDNQGVKAMFSYRALEYLRASYAAGHDRIAHKSGYYEIDFSDYNFEEPLFKRPNVATDGERASKQLINLYERVGTTSEGTNNKDEDDNILETLHAIIEMSIDVGMSISLGAIETILSAYISDENGYTLSRGFNNTRHRSATEVLSNRSLAVYMMLKDQKRMMVSSAPYLVTHRDNNPIDVILDPVRVMRSNNVPPNYLELLTRKKHNLE